jgi:hypothetical protein
MVTATPPTINKVIAIFIVLPFATKIRGGYTFTVENSGAIPPP